MAVKNKIKKEKSVLENPDALADKLDVAEEFISNNKKTAGIVFGALVVIVGGIFGYNFYMNSQNKEAQDEIFQSIYYYEADSLNRAIKGDGNSPGFEEISDKYALTKSGDLASFYLGASLMKKGQFKDAIDAFDNFSSSDLLVQARAYALTGDAYMELGDFKNAAKYYSKASDYNENKFYTPIYLMKLALASEKDGDNKAAMNAYSKIIDSYFDSQEFQEARKHKARLEVTASK